MKNFKTLLVALLVLAMSFAPTVLATTYSNFDHVAVGASGGSGEICLNGSCKTSWGSAGVSPFSDNGTIITDTSTGFFDFTIATGVFSATGLTAGAADIVLENAQKIDGGTNNAFIFTENSDSLSITASGSDWVVDSTDGGVMFTLTDASDGTVDFQTNNDADDYIQISTTTNQPLINFVGCNGSITAGSGSISFGDENLTTTGTASLGATTATSLIIGDDTIDVAVDDVLQFASNDEISTIQAYGFEAKGGRLLLTADEADDATDQWDFVAGTDGSLLISNDTSVSDTFVTKLTITSAGAVTTTGDIVMGGTTPSLTIGDAGAEDTQINFDGNAHDFSVGLEDATDSFVLSLGTTLGTTNVFAADGTTMTVTDALTVTGTTTVNGTLVADGVIDVGTVETWANDDATPDVGTGSYFLTGANADTVTDFDGAGILDGQIIAIESAAAITYDVTGEGLKGGTTDIVTADGDLTTWFYNGTDWLLIAFMDLTDDMS